MRIAMLGPFGLNPKGTMRARALPLGRELARRGHQVCLIMPPWHTPHEPPRIWVEDGLTLRYVALSPPVAGLRHVAITWRMVRAALAWRPDIVHCFKPKAYAGLAGWVLWKLHKLGLWSGRLVIDEDDWEGSGGWNEIEDYNPLMRRFFAWQERWGLRHAHAVTVASRACQSLVWALGVPPDQTIYLPNGAEAGASALAGNGPLLRRKLGLEGRPVVLLYTRFFEFDVARPLQVLALVRQALPQVRLLVVGTGLFAAQDQRFDALTAELGLQEQVLRAGWVAPELLGDYFAASDVGLHLLDDTLINRCKCSAKLVEQLSAGVPMVADAVGQNAEYITHQESGLLTPSGDVAAMAAAVIGLLQSPAERERLARNAQQKVAQHLAWPKLVDDLLKAYR